MRESIKLSCPCGGTFEMGCNTYIKLGGVPDAQGRVFIAELRAHEWLDRHQGCLEPVVKVEMRKPAGEEER